MPRPWAPRLGGGEQIWPNCGLALPGHRSAFTPRTVIGINIPSSPFLGSYSRSKSTPVLRIGLPLPGLLLRSVLGAGGGESRLFLLLSFLIWKSFRKGAEMRLSAGAGPAVYIAPSLGRAQPRSLPQCLGSGSSGLVAEEAG